MGGICFFLSGHTSDLKAKEAKEAVICVERTGNSPLSQQREKGLAQERDSYTIPVLGWHKKGHSGGCDLIFFLPASSFPGYTITPSSQ